MIMIKNHHCVLILVAISAVVLAAPPAFAQYTIPPPDSTDMVFVADDTADDPDLDSYRFGAVEITVEIDRYVGEVDAEGYLLYPDDLIETGALSPYAFVQIAAGDVNEGIGQYDYVYLNDPELAEPIGIMAGVANEFRLFTYFLDVRKLKFPDGTLDENDELIPAENTVYIDIDAFYNQSDPSRTGTNVDWVSTGLMEAWRPVLLAHGWMGTPDVWDNVWRPRLEERGVKTTVTDPGRGRTIEQGAGVVGDSATALMTRYGVDKIVILGHSQGGLDSRRYLWDRGEETVSRLVMLGSPNGGSPWARASQGIVGGFGRPFDVGRVKDAYDHVAGYFLRDLTKENMEAFNERDPSSADAEYVTYAGDYRNTVFGREISWLYPVFRDWNDTAVGVQSAFSVPEAYGATHCLRLIHDATSVHTNLHSSDGVYENLAPYVIERTFEDPTSLRTEDPVLALTTESGPIFGRGGKSALYPVLEQSSGAAQPAARTDGSHTCSSVPPTPSGATASRSTDPATPQQSKSTAGFIAAGETVVAPIVVDAAEEARFRWFAFDGLVDVVLVSPNGERIDPTSASTNPDAAYIALEEEMGMPMHLLAINAPLAGTWQAEISGQSVSSGDSAFFSVDAFFVGATASLAATSDAEVYATGDPVTLSAELAEGAAASLGAAVEARVLLPDTTFQIVQLRDDGTGNDPVSGDGIYTGVYAATSDPGWYAATIVAEQGGANPFSRSQTLMIPVTRGGVAPPSTFGDAGIDSNGNGLFDSLRVDVSVNVPRSSDYLVRATLADESGQPITAASTKATLSSGIHTLSLAFDGRAIRKSGAGGPYDIKDFVLADVGTDMAVELGASATAASAQTNSYTADQFERSAIEPSGSPTETPQDDNGDGHYDKLIVEIGVDLLFADYYQFELQLTDRTGQPIAASGFGPYSLSPGTYVIPFEFDGEQIRNSATDGPYVARNLLVQGVAYGTSLIAGTVIETQPYSHEDFGTPAPDGCVSAASGSWEIPSTWAGCGGGLPSDSVAIQNGHTVTVGTDAEVGVVTVTQGGTLALSDSLYAADVAVEPGAAVTFAAGGVLDVATTLTTAVSLTVTADASLDVAPGGIVRAGDGVLITLQGKTDIRGTAAAPVIFEGAELAAGQRWGGLRLEGDDGFLGYAEVRDADVGVEVRAKDVTLYRLTLSGNGDGVVSDYASGSTLSTSAKSGGSPSKSAAFGGERSRFSVRFSTIEDNAGHGLVLRNADVDVLRNTIANNAGHGVLVWNADAFPFQGNTVTGNGGPSDSTIEDGIAVLSGGDATLYSFGIVYSEGGNTIADNAGHELSVAPGGFLSVGSGAGGHNAVTESAPSTGYHLIYNGTKGTTVSAEETWWGAPSGPPAGAFYGSVDFKPYMTSPPGGSTSLARGVTTAEMSPPAEAAVDQAAYAPPANDDASRSGASGSDVRAWLRGRLRALRRGVGQGAGTNGAPGLLRRLYALQRLDRHDVLGERDATMALFAQMRGYLDGPNLPPPFRRLAEASLAAEVAEALRTESYEEAEALLTEYAPGVEGDARLALVLDAVAVDEQAGRYAEALARLDEVVLSLPPEEEGLARSLGVVASLIEGRMESGERAATGGQAVAKGTPEGGPSWAFALGSAYPNPTRTAATVPFEVPEAADVQIGVYDLLGRRVAVLADERFEPGRHAVTFDANHLATGVYLLRATMTEESGAGHVFTQKLTLLQ